MKITVLGCSGAQFPGHNPAAFLLDGKILLDAGSLTTVLDSHAQSKIKDIFITHAHLDHIRDVSFLADNIIVAKRKQSVNIISIRPVISAIKKNLLNDSLWPDFTMIPDYENAVLRYLTVTEGAPLKVDGYQITAYKVNHSVPAVGYLVEDRKNKRFFYTGDTGSTDATWKKIGDRKLDCLIIEVSFPNRMSEMAALTGHLTSNLLKEEIRKIKQMPDRIYITHIKPQYLKAVRAEIEKLGMKNIKLLKEGDRITI